MLTMIRETLADAVKKGLVMINVLPMLDARVRGLVLSCRWS